MNADKFESMRQIINEDVREISTMTDIRGVEKMSLFLMHLILLD